jgi:hypothetical protein
MKNKLKEICPDFEEWPDSWMGMDEDLPYGKELLKEFEPFALFLIDSGLAKKTIKRHLTNLWLIGGEIIRSVSLYEEYAIPASQKLRDSVEEEGGPLCQHVTTDAEIKSYDSTGKKLHRYLKEMDKRLENK